MTSLTIVREKTPCSAREVGPIRDPGEIGNTPSRIGAATSAVLILGLLWRVIRYTLGFPLWGDEAYVAVTVLERDFAGLSRPPEFYQIAPPGFLWTEWLVVRWLGSSEWALRLVPFLAGVVALWWFRRFCRETTTRRTTLLAVAILAGSFYPVRHATEVKPYASDLLVSLCLTSLGWSVYRNPESSRRWAWLITASVVAVWCSYPAIFPALSLAIFFAPSAFRRSSRRFRIFLSLYCVLTAASWVAMYHRFAGPQALAASFLPALPTWRDAFPPISAPWRLPYWFIQVHTGLMLAYPQGGHHFGSAATTLLVAAGCVRVGRRRSRRPLLWLLLGPLTLALTAAALQRYPYGTSTRVMLYMAPAFCLLAAEGLMACLRLRHRSNRGPLVAAGLFALFPIGGIVHDIIWPYTGFDNVLQRRLATGVASLASPDDEFVVFNGVTPPPLISDLMITRWLQRVAVVRYLLRSRVPVPIHWEPDPNDIRLRPGGRLWFIVQHHGNRRFFPEDRLTAYQAELTARFGTPQFHSRFELPNKETWTISAYPISRRSD